MNKIDKQCVPICNSKCTNADCIAPNVYKCRENYQFRNQNRTECDCNVLFCAEFANRYYNNECICLSEDIIIKDEKILYGKSHAVVNCTFDKNHFERLCQNGICSDNGTCVCVNGYHYNNESSKCVPICENECVSFDISFYFVIITTLSVLGS